MALQQAPLLAPSNMASQGTGQQPPHSQQTLSRAGQNSVQSVPSQRSADSAHVLVPHQHTQQQSQGSGGSARLTGSSARADQAFPAQHGCAESSCSQQKLIRLHQQSAQQVEAGQAPSGQLHLLDSSQQLAGKLPGATAQAGPSQQHLSDSALQSTQQLQRKLLEAIANSSIGSAQDINRLIQSTLLSHQLQYSRMQAATKAALAALRSDLVSALVSYIVQDAQILGLTNLILLLSFMFHFRTDVFCCHHYSEAHCTQG